MRKLCIAALIGLGLIGLSLPAAAEESTTTFIDVPSSNWAYEPVEQMVQRKLFSGYEDNSFQPQKTITRAELAAVLSKAVGGQLPTSNNTGFADVPEDAWYASYAKKVGDYLPSYTDQGQAMFHPDEQATREDLTVAIAKWQQWTPSSAEVDTVASRFIDSQAISEEAIPYVAAALDKEIISGYEDGTFQPQGPVSRAEAAVIFARVFAIAPSESSASTGTTADVSLSNSSGEQTSGRLKLPVPALDSFIKYVGVSGKPKSENYWDDKKEDEEEVEKIYDLAVDSENQIYLLGDKKIRILSENDPSNEHSITYNDKFSFSYTDYEGKMAYNKLSNFQPRKLFYNHQGQIMAAAKNDKEPVVSFFQITPEVKLASFNSELGATLSANDFFVELSDGRMVASNLQDNTLRITSTDSTTTSVALPKGDKLKRKLTAVEKTGSLYILDTLNQQIDRLDISTADNHLEQAASFDLQNIDSVTSHDGVFYVSSDSLIYEITIDGKVSLFADLSKARYRNLPFDIADKYAGQYQDNQALAAPAVHSIGLMCFDQWDNLVFYDSQHHMIRRLHLYEDGTTSSNWAAASTPQNIAGSRLDQPAADRLAVGLWGYPSKDRELYSMTQDQQGHLYFLEDNENGTNTEETDDDFAIRKFDVKTGLPDLNPYTFSDTAKVQPFTTVTAESGETLGLTRFTLDHSLHQGLDDPIILTGSNKNFDSTFVSFFTYQDLRKKLLAYNTNQQELTDHDFLFLADHDTLVYSDVGQKKWYVQNTFESDYLKQNDYKAYDFNFSGEPAAALVQDGKLYIADSGNNLLSRLDAYTGKVESTEQLNHTLQQLTAYNGSFYFVEGMQILQLSTDGTISVYADLENVTANAGVWKPQTNSYENTSSDFGAIGKPLHYLIEASGDLVMVDENRVLWRIRLMK